VSWRHQRIQSAWNHTIPSALYARTVTPTFAELSRLGYTPFQFSSDDFPRKSFTFGTIRFNSHQSKPPKAVGIAKFYQAMISTFTLQYHSKFKGNRRTSALRLMSFKCRLINITWKKPMKPTRRWWISGNTLFLCVCVTCGETCVDRHTNKSQSKASIIAMSLQHRNKSERLASINRSPLSVPHSTNSVMMFNRFSLYKKPIKRRTFGWKRLRITLTWKTTHVTKCKQGSDSAVRSFSAQQPISLRKSNYFWDSPGPSCEWQEAKAKHRRNTRHL